MNRYEAEKTVNVAFSDFFAALYFGLTTLTTVGFGDIYPITPVSIVTSEETPRAHWLISSSSARQSSAYPSIHQSAHNMKLQSATN